MGEPYALEVERGKAREFARAVGGDLGADGVTHPTFLMTGVFWQGPESSPWPADREMGRVLHGEQEFVFPHGPPRVGARLTGVSRVEGSEVKQGKRGGEMTVTRVLTEYRDDDGALVAEVRSTVIETSRAAS